MDAGEEAGAFDHDASEARAEARGEDTMSTYSKTKHCRRIVRARMESRKTPERLDFGPERAPLIDEILSAPKTGPSQQTLNKRARLGKDKW
jgi:hypothetical protein